MQGVTRRRSLSGRVADSTVRGEPLKLISDGPPWIAAVICVGLILWSSGAARSS
jgi:hypothetical protein